MKILVNDLKDKPSLDFICDYTNEIKSIEDIISIKPVNFHLDAFFTDDEVTLSVSGHVDLTLTCAKTLLPVEHQMDMTESIIFGSSEDADFILEDEIDISDILFGYIIAEKPYVVYHPDAKNINFEKEKSIHPAFADLNKLLHKK